MSSFNYTNTVTGSTPDNYETNYVPEDDSFNNNATGANNTAGSFDIPYLENDGYMAVFVVSETIGKIIKQVAFGDTSITTVNLTDLGVVNGQQLFLASLVTSDNDLYYAVMDRDGEYIKATTLGADSVGTINGIAVDSKGDAVFDITSVDGNSQFYLTLDSGANSAPVANSDTSVGLIDHATTVDVIANDSDPDSDSISITAASTTGNAIVAVDSDGNIVAVYTGTLADGQSDTVEITYTLTDSNDADTNGSLSVEYSGGDNSVVQLTVQQAEALAGAGYRANNLGAVTQLYVSDTAENLLVLTGVGIDALHALGVTMLIGAAGEVQLSVSALEAMADDNISLSRGDVVTISDTAAHLSALTQDAIAYLGEYYGIISPLHVTSSGGVDLSFEQAGWLAHAGVTFESSASVTAESDLETNVIDVKTADWLADNNVFIHTNGGDLIVADTADVIFGLWEVFQLNNDLAIGVTGFRVTDTIDTMTSLSSELLARFSSMHAALYISDTAENINALSVSQIQNLGELGIGHIGLSGSGAVHVSVDTIDAFATAGIDFVDDTSVTFTNADNITLDAQDAVWLITNDVQVNDSGNIIVSDTAVNILTLSQYEASSDSNLGIGVDLLMVNDTISNLQDLDSIAIGNLQDLAPYMLVTDTADAISGMNYYTIQYLAGLGVGEINVVDSGSVTVSGTVAQNMFDAGLVFASDSDVTLSATIAEFDTLTDASLTGGMNIDQIQLADTAANIGMLDADALYIAASNGLGLIDVTRGALTLDAEKIAALEARGTVTFMANDTITVSDTIANLVELQEENPAEYFTFGVDKFVVTDTGSEISTLDVDTLETLKDLGVTKIDATSAVSLTESQAAAMSEAGLSFSTGDDVTLNLSHDTIQAMTVDFIDDLATLGISTIEKIDGSFITLNPAVLAEMVNKGIEFADDVSIVAVGTAAELIALINSGADAEDLGVQTIRLVDTGANIAAISLTNIIKLHDLGVSSLDATDDVVTLTTAKAVEYAAEGMTFAEGNIVTVRGAGATIQDLTAEDFTQLGLSNILHLNASDDAITLDASQAGAIALAGLSFEYADSVKLRDTAENIAALTTDAISALGDAGIDSVKVTDDANVVLTFAKALAFYDAYLRIDTTFEGTVEIVDTGANLEELDRTDIESIANIGVTRIDLSDNAASLDLQQLGTIVEGDIEFADDDVLTLADTAGNITNLDAEAFSTLKDMGVTTIDIAEGGGNFTAAQLAAIVDNDISFAEDNTTIVLRDRGDNIAEIDADDYADLTFVTKIDVSDTDVSVSYAQAQAIQTAGIVFTTASDVTLGDTVVNLLTLDTNTLGELASVGIDNYGILDSGDNIAAITISNIRTLSVLGVTTVDSTDGSLTLTASKAVEFASHLMTFVDDDMVTISGKGGSIEDLDAHDVAALGAANVDFIDVTDNAVTLTKAQMEAYVTAGLAFTSGDKITIEMTSGAIQGLSLNDISAYDTAGVTEIDVTDDAALVTKTQMDALVAANISFASGDAVTLQLTSSEVQALSTSDISSYDAAGVDGIYVSTGSVTLTKTQADAFAGTGITFNTTGDVTIGLTGAQVEALGSSTVAGYDAIGVTKIDLSDDAATLTKTQMDTLMDAGLSFASSDAITLEMTGAQAATLNANNFTAYDAAGVTTIDLSDNAATLTKSQMDALLTAGMTFASGDAITVQMTGSEAAALGTSDITAYDMAELAKIDLTDDAATLTKTQMDALVAANVTFASGDVITVQMTSNQANALTIDNITAYDTAGVTTIDLSNNAATLTKAQMDAFVGTGITFASGDAITVQMTGAQAAGLSTDNIAGYDTAGVTKIDLSDDAATLTKTQMDTLMDAGLSFASSDAITLEMTGAQAATLNANNFTAYDAAGVTTIDLSDNAATLTKSQMDALLTAGMTFASGDAITVQMTGSEAAALGTSDITAYDIAELAKIDLTDDAATLTKTQMDALVAANVTFASSDAITVDMTGSQFLALSGSDITAYHAAGVDKIDLSGASVTVTSGMVATLLNANITFASGDDVHMSLTQSQFAALSDGALTLLKGMGIDSFDVTEDPAQATFAQALAIADANLDFGTDNVVISDSASALLQVDDFDFAKLADVGVSTIDLTDAHAAVSLDIAQALADAGLVFADADDVTVGLSLSAFNGLSDSNAAALATAKIDHYEIDDTAAHIAALTTSQIAALGAKGVNAIDMSDNHVVLSAAQVQAFQDAGITFNDSDDVAQKGLPDAVGDTATMNEHVVNTVDVLANDTKQDGLTLSVTEASVVGNNGTVTINEDNQLIVTYTGADIDKGQTATVTVNYTVSDGADTDTAQLVVTVRGTAEDGDAIVGTAKADRLIGTSVGETINGLGGADVIRGGNGDDLIFGGDGKDQLFGGNGKDELRAGQGNDILTGGLGADTFVFFGNRGAERITDFDARGADHDTIALTGEQEITGFNDLIRHHVTESHGDVVINLGGHNSLTLEDVKISELTRADFEF